MSKPTLSFKSLFDGDQLENTTLRPNPITYPKNKRQNFENVNIVFTRLRLCCVALSCCYNSKLSKRLYVVCGSGISYQIRQNYAINCQGIVCLP